MAYRRSYGRTGRSYNRRAPGRAAPRRQSAPRGRRAGGVSGRDVRIVIEMAPSNAVSRPDLAPLVRQDTKGKKARL